MKNNLLKILAALAVLLCLGCAAVLIVLRLNSLPEKQPAAPAETEAVPPREETDKKPQTKPQAKPEAQGKEPPTGTQLAETEDAGQAYVDSTLFIGDSNTARYMLYDYITLRNGIGVVGMGAGSIKSLRCVAFEGYDGMVTIPEAVALMQPRRVVFSFGTNNLMDDREQFIQDYEEGIQACCEAWPYFDVIVNAIPPIAEDCSYSTVSMAAVDYFNEALFSMCSKNGWYFLNSSDALQDYDTGYAYSGYTDGDGLHLSYKAGSAFFDYFRTHALDSEDRRPEGLTEGPEQVRSYYNPVDYNPLDGGSTSDITDSEWWSGGTESYSQPEGGSSEGPEAEGAEEPVTDSPAEGSGEGPAGSEAGNEPGEAAGAEAGSEEAEDDGIE